MLVLAKRLAAFAICVALVGGATPVGVRGDLSASHVPDLLSCDRTGPVPAELGTGRVQSQQIGSRRQVRSCDLQAAIIAVQDAFDAGQRWTRTARPSACAAKSLAAGARADRGPPSHVLS